MEAPTEGRARSSMGATKGAAILVLVLLVGAGSFFVVERWVGGSQPPRTYTVSLSATSTGALSPGNGVELSLTVNSTDISAGHGVAVTVDELNTITTLNNVSASGDWPVGNLAVGPCGPLNYPFGVTVLSGNYDLANVSSVNALQLYQPGTYNCPMILAGIGSFVFLASSDNATIFGSCKVGGGACLSERVDTTVVFDGYWSGNAFTRFPSGIYTVVAGDEWGGIAILHFAVTGGSF